MPFRVRNQQSGVGAGMEKSLCPGEKYDAETLCSGHGYQIATGNDGDVVNLFIVPTKQTGKVVRVLMKRYGGGCDDDGDGEQTTVSEKVKNDTYQVAEWEEIYSLRALLEPFGRAADLFIGAWELFVSVVAIFLGLLLDIEERRQMYFAGCKGSTSESGRWKTCAESVKQDIQNAQKDEEVHVQEAASLAESSFDRGGNEIMRITNVAGDTSRSSPKEGDRRTKRVKDIMSSAKESTGPNSELTWWANGA
jgi:hypothetical protein